MALGAGFFAPQTPGLVVLLYHRVGSGRSNIDLPIRAFEQQLAYLAGTGRVVSMDDGLRELAKKDRENDQFVIAFDDGTEDFHAHVVPLLVNYKLPAIHYVATAPIDERAPYRDWSGSADLHAMTWGQLSDALSTGLVTVGSHTHTHSDLAGLGTREVVDELRRSQDLIEDRLGRACRHFAYPHAVTSCEAERLVPRFYDTAAVAGWRKNFAATFDPYAIQRVPITRLDGSIFFRAKLRGRMSAEGMLYRLWQGWRE